MSERSKRARQRVKVFGFPHPVDEVSARMVAGGVVVVGVAYVTTGWWPLLAVLAYGFVARVLTGPALSPWGRIVTQILRPRLAVAPRPTPGPPKRFAQGIGATLTVAAVVALLVLDGTIVPRVLAGAVATAAALEAVLGFCLGCRIFALLMRLGLVPDDVCAECSDLSTRLA